MQGKQIHSFEPSALPSPPKPMFRVTREIDFCYGHRLLQYEGKCRHLHGHNGTAVIAIEGDQLDHRGMLVDFSDIKSAVSTWIDENLDHRMLLRRDDPVVPVLQEMGEPLYLLDENPTAENIAKLIFDQSKKLKLPVPIVEVRLWETPKCFATYSE
jgi:6-pyruvoyltetrahydropterin/6-carboxytetrahydropterin synthase